MPAKTDSAVTTDAEVVPLCPFPSMVAVLGGQCFDGSSLEFGQRTLLLEALGSDNFDYIAVSLRVGAWNTVGRLHTTMQA